MVKKDKIHDDNQWLSCSSTAWSTCRIYIITTLDAQYFCTACPALLHAIMQELDVYIIVRISVSGWVGLGSNKRAH